MLDICYKTLDTIVGSHKCVIQGNGHPSVESDKCRAMILGSVVGTLIQLGIYPARKKGADLQISVNDFNGMLQKISVLAHASFDPLQVAYAVCDEPPVLSFSGRFAAATKPTERIYWESDRNRPKIRDKGIQSHELCGFYVKIAESGNR